MHHILGLGYGIAQETGSRQEMVVAKLLAKGSVDKNVCFHVRIIDDAKQISNGTGPMILTTSLWCVAVPVAHFISLNGNAFDAAGPAINNVRTRKFSTAQVVLKIALDFINHIAKGFVIVHIEAIDDGTQIVAPQQSAVMLLRDGLKRSSVLVPESPYFIDVKAIDGKALWG